MLKNIFALVFLMLSLSATAQTELSLSTAIEKAIGHNLQIEFQQKQVQLAEQSDNWANAGRTPTIDATIFNQSAINRQVNPANVILPEQLSYTTGLQGSVDMNLVLFNGGRIKLNKNNLSLQTEQARLDMRIAIEDLSEQVMIAYYNILLLEEQLKVLEEVKTLSRDRLDFQELRQSFGSASTFDVLQAKDAYLNDSITCIQLDNQLVGLTNNLKLLMGEAQGAENYTLTNDLEDMMPLISEQELRQRMLDNNSDLANLRLADQLAQNSIALEKTSLKPTIAMSAGFNSNLNSSYLDAENPITMEIIGANTSSGVNPFVGISATYRIFDGGVRKNRVQNAELRLLSNQDLRKNLEQSLGTQFNNTYLQLEANQQVLLISTDQLDHAAQNLEIAKDRYENGLISSFDYRSIQLGYLNAAQRKLEAHFDVLNAQIALMNITGGLYQLN
jgi:outer membrane protein